MKHCPGVATAYEGCGEPEGWVQSMKEQVEYDRNAVCPCRGGPDASYLKSINKYVEW